MDPNGDSENSEQPAQKKSKLSHESPVSVHETLSVLPDQCADGQVRPIFSEIFAGCGRLSRAAKQLGFATLPVDGPRNEHKPECQILTLDLVDTTCQQMLLENLRILQPQAIHVALPCGTGS